jgi:hypothetical protein
MHSTVQNHAVGKAPPACSLSSACSTTKPLFACFSLCKQLQSVKNLRFLQCGKSKRSNQQEKTPYQTWLTRRLHL